MVTSIRSWGQLHKFNLSWARFIILFLWIFYSTFQILFLDQPFVDLIGFMVGAISIISLIAAGFSTRDCYLRFTPISKKGAVLYAVTFLLWLAMVIPTGGKPHWDWLSVFVYAPATSVTQELFFRSALLPLLLTIFKGNFKAALIAHSFLFGIWHMGVFTTNAPISIAIIVVMVPMFFSMAWGWQTQRDGTVVWAILHHTSLQIVMRLFTWG